MSQSRNNFLELPGCKKNCKDSKGDCGRVGNCKFSSEDIKKMSLADFEKNFGFRPVDKVEKFYFSTIGRGKRLIDVNRRRALENWDLSGVVFA